MFADYYKWFPILNSGVDSEAFNRIAVMNQSSSEILSRTNYTYFLTLIYYLTDSSRLIAQYFNVLFGLGVVILVQKSIATFRVNRKAENVAMAVVILLPNLIIFSGILLREAWVEFFVAASLYCFLKWFRTGGTQYMVFVITYMLAAMWMHSGVVGLLAGYLVAFITYNPRKYRVDFLSGTIFRLILLVLLVVGFMGYSEMFTGKFNKYESVDDIVDVTNYKGGGGSDYLTWINVNSVSLSLLFSPLKMLYFLFSPLPTEWRGINDVIGFLIDGSVYLFLIYKIVRSEVASRIPKLLKRYLLISVLVATFIFAYGTTNAGTAFRHRAKLLPVILITYVVSTGVQRKQSRK
ncbi:hypothetical protein ACGE0T_05010 [Parabacteroides sp. APC149_11_2_Y6]